MTMLDPDHRHHIEAHLRRELTPEELATAPTFDDLTREQLRIVHQLERREILAGAYLRAVVPSTGRGDARDFVRSIQDLIAEKYWPGPLAAEHLYEGGLGRPLADQERRVVDSDPGSQGGPQGADFTDQCRDTSTPSSGCPTDPPCSRGDATVEGALMTDILMSPAAGREFDVAGGSNP